MGKLDADLVVAARSEVDLHQGSVLLCPYHFIFQHRFFRSGGAWLYDAGCVAPSVFYKEILSAHSALPYPRACEQQEYRYLPLKYLLCKIQPLSSPVLTSYFRYTDFSAVML